MEFDFVTRFKKGVLNVLPHELSHCYDLLELDFGRGEKLGDKGAGLLGKAVLVARGVGTGFDQGLKKFLQEKLDKLRKERKALMKSLPFRTKGTNTKRERERKINPINKSDLFVLL